MPLTRKFSRPFLSNTAQLSNSIFSADFPKLNDVRGAFNLQSNQNLDEACSEFQQYKDNSVIKGSFTCRGEEEDPEGSVRRRVVARSFTEFLECALDGGPEPYFAARRA